jgi:hypothetical protein
MSPSFWRTPLAASLFLANAATTSLVVSVPEELTLRGLPEQTLKQNR